MEPTSKVTITQKANELLDELLLTVNDGFMSGRIEKFQLASWLILNFKDHKSAKFISQIRAAHFDKKAHMRSVLLQMEEAEKKNEEIKLDDLLAPLMTKSLKQAKAEPDES